jgi:site-specific recombinase XerD
VAGWKTTIAAPTPFAPTYRTCASSWHGSSSKPATVNRKLASLASLYRWAADGGQAKQDPTRHVSGIAQQATAPKALSGEQTVTKILRKAHQADNRRDIALLELLSATGLRVSEVAALTVEDVAIGEQSGWVTVRSGKGRRQRRVPINAKARRCLHDYLAEREALPGVDALFLTARGTPMSSYAVWYTVKKYAAQAGLENVTTHSFRHTVGTRLVRDPNVDLVTAAAFLGHARLDTSARYSQPSDDDLARAAERV